MQVATMGWFLIRFNHLSERSSSVGGVSFLDSSGLSSLTCYLALENANETRYHGATNSTCPNRSDLSSRGFLKPFEAGWYDRAHHDGRRPSCGFDIPRTCNLHCTPSQAAH